MSECEQCKEDFNDADDSFFCSGECKGNYYAERCFRAEANLQASQDDVENAFKRLAEMTRMYLDLKEGIDRMHSKLKQASETKGEG